MIYSLLRGRSFEIPVLEQQKIVLEYAQKSGFSIDASKTDNSPESQRLEERGELKPFFANIKQNDQILLCDLWVLSKKVGELAKAFECLLKKKASVHICAQNVVIDRDIHPLCLLEIFSKQRDENIKKQKTNTGRPKGSLSPSKFDLHKNGIVKMLRENLSVAQIAKNIGASRTSLKDYINSRELKAIAQTANNTQQKTVANRPVFGKSCNLNQKEG